MARVPDDDILGAQTANTNDASLPIFNVERVQLNFEIASNFVAGQVANNVLILALATNRILRIDLENPSDIDGKHTETLPHRPCANSDQMLTYLNHRLRLG